MICGVVASQQLLTRGAEGVEVVSLLTSWDGSDAATTAIDDSIYAHVPTFQGAAQIDTTQSVFGGASVLFGGIGDRVRWPNHSVFDIGNQMFCIEGRIRPSDVTSSSRQVCGVWDTSASPQKSWRVNFNGGGNGLAFEYSADGTTTVLGPVSGTLAVDTWYAYCIERDESDIIRMYIDGVMQNSSLIFATFFSSSKDLIFGQNPDGTAQFLGWQDETRLIVGAAPYASDAGYTPLATPFPRNGAGVISAVGSASGIGAASGISQAGAAIGSAAGVGVAVANAQAIVAAIGTAAAIGNTSATSSTISSHRYWRLNITDNNTASNDIAGLIELQLHIGSNGFGADQCEGGTASADSINDANHAADNAFDGMMVDGAGNIWASTNTAFPHWIAYDLGSNKAVTGVSITARSLAGASGLDQTPKDFNVQFSDNGSSWTTAWSETGQTYTAAEHRYFQSPSADSYSGSPHGAHQYWRMVTLVGDGGTAASCTEMEFRATPSGADQATGGSAIEDGHQSSFVSANAFDNNNATFFIGTGFGDGIYVGYNFGSSVSVAEVTYRNRDDSGANQAPTYAAIQYADSGSGPWTTAWTVNGQTGWTLGQTRTFTDPNYV